MAKSKEKLKARQLRREGESIKVIAKVLKVSVGSVSLWCNDITLNEEQINRLRIRVQDPYYGKKKAYLEKIKSEMIQKVDSLRLQGIAEVGQLSKRDIFLIGIALYWGEGFKKDHQVGLASSDVNIAKMYIYWLEKCFNITRQELIVRITANYKYKPFIDAIEDYWSECLCIPKNSFSKPFYQRTRWKKIFEHESNYHGVIRIKVKRSVNLLRKIYGYIEGLSNNIPR